MKLKFYICSDDPRMILKLKDRLKDQRASTLVISPYLATTEDGHIDQTKKTKYFVLEFDNDLTPTIQWHDASDEV